MIRTACDGGIQAIYSIWPRQVALVKMRRTVGFLVVFDYGLQRLVAGVSRVSCRKRGSPPPLAGFFGREIVRSIIGWRSTTSAARASIGAIAYSSTMRGIGLSKSLCSVSGKCLSRTAACAAVAEWVVGAERRAAGRRWRLGDSGFLHRRRWSVGRAKVRAWASLGGGFGGIERVDQCRCR
jgi:hypothetical protein